MSKSRRTSVQPVERFGPLAVLVVLCVALAIAQPRFISATNVTGLLNQAAVPLVVGCGITLVILMGSIDLSAEGVMGVTSIVVSLLVLNTSNHSDLGILGVLIALAAGAAFGLLNGLLHTLLRLPSLMATLGTWFVGLGLASYLFPSAQPKITDAGFREIALGKVLGLTWGFYLAVAVILTCLAMMRWTRLGRMIYGIGAGESQLITAGIDVRLFRIAAFTISGLLAGLAGIIASSQIGVGSVSAGYNQLFPAVSAIVIGGTHLSGGRGGILQTVVGVLILAVIDNGLLLLGVNPNIQQAVVGLALVVIVIATGWRLRAPLRIVK